MRLSTIDVLASLGQLAAVTSSEADRTALNDAIAAVQFRDAIERAIERHASEQAQLTPSPRSPGAAWGTDEDLQLRTAFEAGMTLDAIAQQHGREPVEVAARLHRPLGILTEQAVEEIRSARSRQRREVESAAVAPAVVTDPTPAPKSAPPSAAAPVPTSSPAPAPVPAPAPALASAPAPDVKIAELQPQVAQEPVPAPAASAAGAAVATVVSVSAPMPPADEASAELAAPALVFEGGKPVLTNAEEKAVTSVLSKYTAKNGPKATLRTYIESDKFTTKVRPGVLEWLRAELDRLG